MAKHNVVMIQESETNPECKRVRIDGTEFDVLRCSPQPGPGRMDFILTLSDVDVKFEVKPDAQVKA